jgi:predicted nuclease with TOPRIM domain
MTDLDRTTIKDRILLAQETRSAAAANKRTLQQFRGLFGLVTDLPDVAEKYLEVLQDTANGYEKLDQLEAERERTAAEVAQIRAGLLDAAKRDERAALEAVEALRAEEARLTPRVAALRAEEAALLADNQRLLTAKANLAPVGA